MTEQARPVLLVVDDDSETLDHLRRLLEERYGSRFLISAQRSAEDARQALKTYERQGPPLALLLADCGLDGGSGADLLEEAGALFPQARRVLMAGYEEKDDVIEATRRLALDHSLLMPVQKPEDELYPLVDELLEDWFTASSTADAARGVEPAASPNGNGFSAVRIVGYRWTAPSHRLREFLSRNLIPYKWIDFEREEGREQVRQAGLDARCLPVVFFPDGSHLQQPSVEDLAGKVGLQQEASARFYDLVVVGGGPAGLSAAVYGASEGLRTLLIEAEAPGGQAGASSRIENYLGFPAGLSGAELTRRAVTQAQRFGVEILTPQRATGVRERGNYHLVQLASGGEVACSVLLIATGVSYRRLDVPGASELTGAGVYYGAVITEAISCQDREVFILGGGNSAGQAAVYLSRFAKGITILTNTAGLEETMSQYLIEQIEDSGNIRVRPRSTISAVQGKDRLESVTIQNTETGEEETAEAVALFIYIGAQPRTDWLGDLVARDDQGYILTGQEVVEAGHAEAFRALKREPFFLESSVPGIFAAGDTRAGSVKRIASSVGEGAMAVTLAHQYLAS